jgi:hypothetical protein
VNNAASRLAVVTIAWRSVARAGSSSTDQNQS